MDQPQPIQVVPTFVPQPKFYDIGDQSANIADPIHLVPNLPVMDATVAQQTQQQWQQQVIDHLGAILAGVKDSKAAVNDLTVAVNDLMARVNDLREVVNGLQAGQKRILMQLANIAANA